MKAFVCYELGALPEGYISQTYMKLKRSIPIRPDVCLIGYELDKHPEDSDTRKSITVDELPMSRPNDPYKIPL